MKNTVSNKICETRINILSSFTSIPYLNCLELMQSSPGTTAVIVFCNLLYADALPSSRRFDTDLMLPYRTVQYHYWLVCIIIYVYAHHDDCAYFIIYDICSASSYSVVVYCKSTALIQCTLLVLHPIMYNIILFRCNETIY